MNITKAQSKKLRYICGVVEYNQPCTRKYTVTPDGKVREIGKFRYVEKDGKLESFAYGMFEYDLSRLTFDELLTVIVNEASPAPESPAESIAEEETATPKIDDPVYTMEENQPHPVNITVTVETPGDKWADPDDTSDWVELDEMEKVQAARAMNASSPESTKADVPESKPIQLTQAEFESALRETSMNAAALEATRLLNIECDIDDAASIIRANASVPNFMETYGKCLEKVGTPHSLYEIAEAFPNQRKWLFSLPIHFAEVKE